LRLIIVTNSQDSTSEGRNALTAFLQGKGWNIWHWFEDVWLISDAPEGDEILESLRDEIRGLVGIRQFLILSGQDPTTLSGMTTRDGQRWLKTKWAGSNE
jgi:hypothetical protein